VSSKNEIDEVKIDVHVAFTISHTNTYTQHSKKEDVVDDAGGVDVYARDRKGV